MYKYIYICIYCSTDYFFLDFSEGLLSFLVFSKAFVPFVSTSVVGALSKNTKRSKFHAPQMGMEYHGMLF